MTTRISSWKSVYRISTSHRTRCSFPFRKWATLSELVIQAWMAYKVSRRSSQSQKWTQNNHYRKSHGVWMPILFKKEPPTARGSHLYCLEKVRCTESSLLCWEVVSFFSADFYLFSSQIGILNLVTWRKQIDFSKVLKKWARVPLLINDNNNNNNNINNNNEEVREACFLNLS